MNILELIKSGLDFNTADIIGQIVIEVITKLIFFATYPLYAIGLLRLAKRKGLKFYWLALIPKVNNYILGSIVESIDILGIKIKKLGFVMLILTALSYVPIPFLGSTAALLNLMLFWITIHRLYEIYLPARADLYLIIGIVSDCLTPLMIYSIRNATKTYSKLIVDDNGDGIYDREIKIEDNGTVIEHDLREEYDAVIEDDQVFKMDNKIDFEESGKDKILPKVNKKSAIINRANSDMKTIGAQIDIQSAKDKMKTIGTQIDIQSAKDKMKTIGAQIDIQSAKDKMKTIGTQIDIQSAKDKMKTIGTQIDIQSAKDKMKTIGTQIDIQSAKDKLKKSKFTKSGKKILTDGIYKSQTLLNIDKSRLSKNKLQEEISKNDKRDMP